MTLRADHVAGLLFVGVGVLVFALSGELPTGTLSMPGAGFLPKILAGLSILFGLVLVLRAGESRPFAAISWSDALHAAPVVIIAGAAIAGAAIALFEWLGFLITMALMMVALLVIVERRNPLFAALYSVGVVALTYVTFVYLLKTPLPVGPFGY
jgi:hypothetical protein